MRQVLVLALLAPPACAHIQKEHGHDAVGNLVQERAGQRTGWEQGSPEGKQIAERVRSGRPEHEPSGRPLKHLAGES